MNKAELIHTVAEKASVTKKQADAVLTAAKIPLWKRFLKAIK